LVLLSLATATAVAQTGLIAFVGLAAPHLVRALVRDDPKQVLWPSALAGALLLVIADLAARLNACYALPAAQRVSDGTNAGSTLVAPACRTLFSQDDPTTFLSNGARVGPAQTAAYSSLFRDGAVGLRWEAGAFDFYRANGDWIVSYKVVLPDGTEKLGPDGEKELVEIDELDSGIFLRGNSKCQINLWNWNCGSGEIYGYRTDPKQSPESKAAYTPKHKADFPAGQWTRTMITVKGQQVSVTMNGHSLIENAILDGMPPEGPIGLQHHGQAIDFANIWVKRD
jgi:hypothetical protein